MKQHIVPDKWKAPLRRYLKEKTGEDREKLSAYDFNSSVLLRFPDGSFALFRFAFYLLDEGDGEVAVFTEHCGYHIFPSEGVELELLQSIWTGEGC